MKEIWLSRDNLKTQDWEEIRAGEILTKYIEQIGRFWWLLSTVEGLMKDCYVTEFWGLHFLKEDKNPHILMYNLCTWVKSCGTERAWNTKVKVWEILQWRTLGLPLSNAWQPIVLDGTLGMPLKTSQNKIKLKLRYWRNAKM